ncbi:hypothetical protein KDN24_05460 [Bacillus sp. Bva_UNVM-123]|uniref:hypothetical protein n=1 Tax=Bacillus sp. Bva_UNVM-123 TaxID=2829798 RepID=UPI00391F5D1C
MPKTYTFGNTTVIVHSPLAHMTSEERREFFRSEWEKGNPVLKEIAQAAHDCLKASVPEKLAKYS